MDPHSIITNGYAQILIPVFAVAIGMALMSGAISKAMKIVLAVLASAAFIFMTQGQLRTIGNAIRDLFLNLLQIK